jgi:hypothetical protein
MCGNSVFSERSISFLIIRAPERYCLMIPDSINEDNGIEWLTKCPQLIIAMFYQAIIRTSDQ